MKKWCVGVLLALCVAARPCFALSAAAYCVLNADTGRVIAASNETTRLPMASTTKIMTGLLAAEDDNPDRAVCVPADCAGVEGSSMYLKAGELLPLRDVLYGLMLCSGNDAAECIAAVCGGREAFVARMNARAQALGLTDTHFDNPSGLDGDTHDTTAYDLARLAAAALQNPVFAEVVSTKSYTSGGRTMTNHNKLLRRLEDCIGVKTGYTKTAGRCLVSAVRRKGRTVVCVTLNDGDDWNDHQALLSDAFAEQQTQTFAAQGECAAPIAVVSGMQATVSAVYAHDLTLTLLKGEQAHLRVSTAPFFYAPVKAGTVCGMAEVVEGDTVLCRTELLTAQNVACDMTQERTDWRYRLERWWNGVRGWD